MELSLCLERALYVRSPVGWHPPASVALGSHSPLSHHLSVTLEVSRTEQNMVKKRMFFSPLVLVPGCRQRSGACLKDAAPGLEGGRQSHELATTHLPASRCIGHLEAGRSVLQRRRELQRALGSGPSGRRAELQCARDPPFTSPVLFTRTILTLTS